MTSLTGFQKSRLKAAYRASPCFNDSGESLRRRASGVEINPDVRGDVERLSVSGERLISPEPYRVHCFILQRASSGNHPHGRDTTGFPDHDAHDHGGCRSESRPPSAGTSDLPS